MLQLSKEYPYDPSVMVHFAQLKRKEDDLVGAASCYGKAIQLFKDQGVHNLAYVRTLLASGSLEVQAGNVAKARSLFTESVEAAVKEQENGEMELKSALVYGLHAWAMLEQRLGNWSKARELLERAANVQPGNAVVHQTRALLEARAHNYAAARFHFRLAVEAAPEDVKCWQVRWDATEQNIGKWVFRCQCLHSLSSFCLIQNSKLEVDEEQVEVS
jgi:tetratricopeptide (TPR) repeat protein